MMTEEQRDEVIRDRIIRHCRSIRFPSQKAAEHAWRHVNATFGNPNPKRNRLNDDCTISGSGLFMWHVHVALTRIETHIDVREGE